MENEESTYERFEIDVALEDSIIAFRWSFWQYYGVGYCDLLPDASVSDEELFYWLNFVSAIANDSDSTVAFFEPWYYQSSFQLGYGYENIGYLGDSLLYRDMISWNDPMTWGPVGVATSYDPAPMQDLVAWVGSGGRSILLIYGEYDPWFSAALDLGQAEDSYRLVVAEGTHGANIFDLSANDSATALAAIGRWSGVTTAKKPAARMWRREEYPRHHKVP